MKLYRLFLFLFFIFYVNSFMAMASPHTSPIKIAPRVIYGLDDRMDVYETSDNLMVEIALSTAVQIMNFNLIQNKDGLFSLDGKALSEYQICKSERFSNQMSVGKCSGFLVAPDKLVTAGHCINSVADCSSYSWVFDYANTESEKTSFTFNREQIYHCTKIIERQKNVQTQADYAVLKLDRPVTNRRPLTVRREGKPHNDDIMAVIGNPKGLPTKITSVADIRKNDNPIFFVINSDTYKGNSGSAVVDSRTGIVEGVLVRGGTDFVKTENGCYVSVYNEQNSGRGEDATRITIIKSLR